MDEDLEMDDLDEAEIEDEDEDLQELSKPAQVSIPRWRLIEMSREDRLLKLQLADFDDSDGSDSFTEFESAGDEHAEAY